MLSLVEVVNSKITVMLGGAYEKVAEAGGIVVMISAKEGDGEILVTA